MNHFLIILVAAALVGCVHKPSRTVTIPTPEVEYSHPEFKQHKSIYNPPLPPGAAIPSPRLEWEHDGAHLNGFKLYVSSNLSNWDVQTLPASARSLPIGFDYQQRFYRLEAF